MMVIGVDKNIANNALNLELGLLYDFYRMQDLGIDAEQYKFNALHLFTLWLGARYAYSFDFGFNIFANIWYATKSHSKDAK